MPTYEVTDPTGKTWDVTAPEGATQAQVLAYAQQQFKTKQAAGEKQLAADKETYSPTAGMGGGEKFLAGTGKAIVDAGRGIAGLFGADNRADIEESRGLDAPLMKTGAGFGGNVAGNVLMALAPGGAVRGTGVVAGALGKAGVANALAAGGQAMIAPTTLRGAAALGGAVGAAQPALDWNERGTNALMGGAAGAGGQAAFNTIARVVRPNTSPAVSNMLADGVTPTPGQVLGGGFKRAEDALTSVPIVGDAIKKGQRRAVADLNRTAINRALEPIGQKLPKNAHLGRETIEYVEDALGAKYDALMPRLTTHADGKFITEIQALRNSVGEGAIDPAMAQRFEKILNNQLLTKFQGPNATMLGPTLKQVEGDLGGLARQFRASADPDQRLLGDAIREAQDILRETVTRSNPQVAKELKAINTGWANFKRVQKAAAGLGADEGLFSPAQLQSAVKAADRSKDKAAFARGNALMQDLSEPAKAALGGSVPDSGTAMRTMMAMGAGGGAALLHPGLAAGVLAAPAVYSRPGQAALAALLARRPAAAVPTANALRQIGSYAAVPGALAPFELEQRR